jgi:hypothetical protein
LTHTFLAKTKFAETSIREYLKVHKIVGPKVEYMSHSSPDPLDLVPPETKTNYSTFYHGWGHSGRKSTHLVIDCWKSHPEWPPLILVGNKGDDEFEGRLKKIKNIRRFTQLPTHELRKLQFEAGVHICPSSMEGYGHYIK